MRVWEVDSYIHFLVRKKMIECYNRRQEELLEYLFKEFKDTSGLKKLFIDLSPFSKGKEG